jgi:hypothetical protein
MLSIMLVGHHYIPPYISFYEYFLSDYKTIHIEPVYAMALVGAAIAGLTTYKRLQNKAEAKYQVMHLTRTYEHKIALEAIHHQANWTRLDMTYGNYLFKKINAKIQEKGNRKEVLSLLLQKLHQFHNLLLRKTKAEPSLELHEHTLQKVAFETVMLKTYETTQALGAPIQLLLYNQSKIKYVLVDPTLFECFLMLNLWEISKSTQASDHTVTLTICDTTLRYNGTTPTDIDQAELILPALAFCFSTETTKQNIASAYDIKDLSLLTYIPKTEKQFYQWESRQIVQAHGGYTEIIETSAMLTCLYILPVEGRQVMHFKNYEAVATGRQYNFFYFSSIIFCYFLPFLGLWQ